MALKEWGRSTGPVALWAGLRQREHRGRRPNEKRPPCSEDYHGDTEHTEISEKALCSPSHREASRCLRGSIFVRRGVALDMGICPGNRRVAQVGNLRYVSARGMGNFVEGTA